MRKLLALALVFTLALALFAGCSDSKNPVTDPSATPSAAVSPTNTPDAAKDDGEDSSTKLPLVDTTANFVIWALGPYPTMGIADFNEAEAFIELERRTNVHIDWILPSRADTMTSLNLTLASDQLPDSFMIYYSMLTAGLDAAIVDGTITEVSDLVDQYCPNYKYQISQPDLARGVLTDAGNLPGFYGIKYTFQPTWTGPIARLDWLDELGLDAPRTFDEFHDMLAAFKGAHSECTAPMALSYTGLQADYLAAFNIGTAFYQENGTVKYGPMQDVFLDYLTLMNKWYDEGLIDPDFYTGTSTQSNASNTAYTLTGKMAVWNTTYQTIHQNMELAASTGDTGYELMAIPIPTINAGDTRHIGGLIPDRFQGNIGTISPNCEDKVTLVKWYDYLFSDNEGWILSSYGTGTAFFLDKDGHPRGNELIYNNPDALSPYNAMCLYSMMPDIPTLYDWERELLVTMNDNALAAFDIWDANYEDTLTLPRMLFPTAEESAEYAAIMGDINTYLSEMVVKFIIGVEPLTKFEDFRQNLIITGIERASQLRQDARDRYNAR